MVSPHRDEYLGAMVSILAFGLLPLLLHHARPLKETPICPLNWALFAFFLQLVALPLLVCFYGPTQTVLPELPSKAAINIALLLFALSYASFCIGYHVVAARFASDTGPPPRPWPASSRGLIALYLGLGILGLALTFHNLDSLLGYLQAGASGLQGVQDSPAKLAGIVLRAFLGFAFVIIWCRWIDRARPRSIVIVIGATLVAAAAIVVSYATFSFSRGAFVAPIIALLAVYGLRVRRLSIRWLVVLAVIGAGLLSGFRVYRESDAPLGQLLVNQGQREQLAKKTHISRELQLYAGAPQFTGFLLAKTDYASDLRYGKTLIASAIAPVPRLGRPFRASTGAELYNRLIYGNADVADQIISLQGELFINFHLPGVIVGYLLFGLLMQRLQRGFERAPTSLQAFSWQYAATWLNVVVGSVLVISQVLVYFFWPIYALALWTWLRPAVRRMPRPSLPETSDRSQLART
jgi:hypothetical protein